MGTPTVFSSNIFGKPMPSTSWSPAAPTNSRGVVSIGPQQSNAYQQPGNSMLDQYNAIAYLNKLAAAPQDQAIDQNVKQQYLQLGLNQANLGMQTGYINQDAALQGQRLDLQGQGTINQQAALNRQNPLLGQQHALNLQDLAQQQQEAMFGAGQQQTQLTNQAVGQGALQSVGARTGFSDIAKQLGFQQSTIGRNQQRENLSYNEQKAQLQDSQKSLDLASKGLGIDRQDLTNRTQKALQDLGLSSALKVSDITQAINDLNAGRYNPIQSLLGSIYQSSGIRPVAGG